jgi:hypothetical protein
LTSYEKGGQLERRVANLFRLKGYQVRTNVLIRNSRGHLSEIDVVASPRWPWRATQYIECKNYSRPLPLHSVANFKEVLLQNSLPLNQALLVTTAKLSPRVRAAGIRVWDGKQLKEAEIRTAQQVARVWYWKAAMLLGGSYVVLLLFTPALEWVAARTSSTDTAKAVLAPLSRHRCWWSEVATTTASSPHVRWALEAVPEPLARLWAVVSKEASTAAATLKRALSGTASGGDDD